MKVSIGVPTYNGVEFIRECLECLQTQSFEEFEVVISDNASNDGTSDICAEFARIDSRFKHFRSRETIDASSNFKQSFNNSTGQYFLWRADDDLGDKEHLGNLVKALDENPSAVLSVAPTLRINTLYAKKEVLFPLPKIKSKEKVGRICETLIGCRPTWVYGLWRREAIPIAWQQVDKYPYIWAADHLFMLPAIFGDATVMAPGANFIQRIVRKANYGLSPPEKLIVRDIYKSLATEILNKGNWNSVDFKKLEIALDEHLELCVAAIKPKPKKFKHKIKSWLLYQVRLFK